jgi:hypothetical protein
MGFVLTDFPRRVDFVYDVELVGKVPGSLISDVHFKDHIIDGRIECEIVMIYEESRLNQRTAQKCHKNFEHDRAETEELYRSF